MTGWQIVIALILGLLLIASGYVAFRILAYQLDKRWPDKVEVAPAAPVTTVKPVSEPAPPMAWWEELEALRSQFGTLQVKVQGALTTAENQLKLARASEERTRKMQANGEGVAPALPVLLPGGWENEEAPAPVGRQLSILDQRRAR